MRLRKAIESRRSIREFSKKKVRWDKVLEAIDSAIQAPFAGNNNNLKFIIVEDSYTKNQISELCQQYWIASAGIVVVVCADQPKMEKLYFERGKHYSKQQAGAAIQNFLLTITDLGLSACWVGAYSDELLKQLLKIPTQIEIEAVIPIGHSAKKRIKKPKKDSLEKAIHWESYGKKKKPRFEEKIE